MEQSFSSNLILKKKKKIPSNSLNIFILSVNFENLTIKLHVLIIFSCLQNFKKIKNQLCKDQFWLGP